jgi:hypothetical protein
VLLVLKMCARVCVWDWMWHDVVGWWMVYCANRCSSYPTFNAIFEADWLRNMIHPCPPGKFHLSEPLSKRAMDIFADEVRTRIKIASVCVDVGAWVWVWVNGRVSKS